jgi:hypothetical protein
MSTRRPSPKSACTIRERRSSTRGTSTGVSRPAALHCKSGYARIARRPRLQRSPVLPARSRPSEPLRRFGPHDCAALPRRAALHCCRLVCGERRSCCPRKKFSDFNDFLSAPGCTVGTCWSLPSPRRASAGPVPVLCRASAGPVRGALYDSALSFALVRARVAAGALCVGWIGSFTESPAEAVQKSKCRNDFYQCPAATFHTHTHSTRARAQTHTRLSSHHAIRLRVRMHARANVSRAPWYPAACRASRAHRGCVAILALPIRRERSSQPQCC